VGGRKSPELPAHKIRHNVVYGSRHFGIGESPVSNGRYDHEIKQAISSAILLTLVTAPTAWGQDNIRAAMEDANKEWSAAYNSMNGKAFPALYTKDAILMSLSPGVQAINGSEAIGQFWTDLLKAETGKISP
jgi:hypothetical protein